MNRLSVSTRLPYDILQERGLLDRAGEIARAVNAGVRAVIVTDAHVAPLYADRLERSLTAAGYAASTFVLPAGESQKTLAAAEQIYATLATRHIGRKDLLISLGGGVVGDLTGFVAATWMRGIDYIQVPTTLLSQVDASVGGKTAVDTAAGKNMVGCFWQPKAVILDADLLDSLPHGEMVNGMAEVIKTAAIRDAELFAVLQAGVEDHEQMIARTVAVKAAIVAADERESGERMLLNFGHTVGHALEKASYFTLPHGHAVSLGMVAVTLAAEAAGICESGTLGKLIATLQKYGLPTNLAVNSDGWIKEIANDKKCDGEEIRLVLLRRIGDSFVRQMKLADLPYFLAGEDAPR